MKTLALTFSALSLLSLNAGAFSIALDYSHSASSFFDTNTADGLAARAAVAAAAADLSNAVTSSLAALSSPDLVYTGSNGATTSTFTAHLSYTNPDTGAQVDLTDINLAANEFRVYVGSRSLGGSTLGQGGPGGLGYTPGGGSSSPDYATEWAGAVATAETNFNNALGRDTDVEVGSFSDVVTLGGVPASFTLGFGPTVGNLWFDNDGSSSWHLDHTTAVGFGMSDLYSVALHEMLHAIGIGTYGLWDAQVSGTDWLGAEVIALQGSGVGLIDGGGGHIATGVMSPRLSDGVMQEVVMDPNLTTGTRKELTELDLAFLRDLNFTTVPEPSTMILMGLAALGWAGHRRREAC